MSPSLASSKDEFFHISTREFHTLLAVFYFRRALCHPGLLFPVAVTPGDPEEFQSLHPPSAGCSAGETPRGPDNPEQLDGVDGNGWNGCRGME